MRILISGARGLVGTALTTALKRHGHETMALVRGTGPPAASSVRWDPVNGVSDPGGLEGLDAVVHLAGENIAAGRWTARRKKEIRDSRILGTQRLLEALLKAKERPLAFIAASAVGFYGNRGDTVLEEESSGGEGFLADLCRDWEAAAQPLEQRGIRVVYLRFGVVFSDAGGALPKMAAPFRLGLGGRVGNGRQYLSWIALDDAVRAIEFLLADEKLKGPFNLVAPNPVTNAQFTQALGRVLHRPAVVPSPAFAARWMFGEMAEALLLASARVHPRRLLDAGFQFHYPYIQEVLRHCLHQ